MAPGSEVAEQVSKLTTANQSNDVNQLMSALTFSDQNSKPSLQQLAMSSASKQASSGHKKYKSVLEGRYGSPEMSNIWSDDTKFGLWRKMWFVLAQTQMELGVNINAEQVAELANAVNMPIDYELAAEWEKELRHDVMAHVHTLKKICPNAAPIIHLGSTSCDITDNAELIQLRDAMRLTLQNGLNVLNALRKFALDHKDVVTVGRTHGQTAQLTTVGKRACMWAESLQLALENLKYQIDALKLRGIKGATGTQSTLAALLNNDIEKVAQFEAMVCAKLGFKDTFDAEGQTYHRIVDHLALTPVVAVATTIAKICEDIRFLASHDEIGEPFESTQVGSSAMPYKQNPMRCERADGLARTAITLSLNPLITAATQWLERSLDDSANRRIVLADTFMLVDAVLSIASNVVPGLRVHNAVIDRHVQEQLPFVASELIILDSVAQSGDRQEIHEAIRQHSTEVYKNVKEKGLVNDLIARICEDARFPQSVRDTLMAKNLEARDYIGLAPQQVEKYCAKLLVFLEQNGFNQAKANRAALTV